MLKFSNEIAKFIYFFFSEINNYKEINKIDDNTKKIIFTVHIQRKFNLEKKTDKVTTVLMTDKKMNQLFIDNLNGARLELKDAEKMNIDYFINQKIIEPQKLIKEEIMNFFIEKRNENMGICKGIDFNNFIQEFESFIGKSEEVIPVIEKIILAQINNNENFIDLIIKDKKLINQNSTDFFTVIIEQIKAIFKEKIRIFLTKTENNNFFTTIFILNVNNNLETKDSSLNHPDVQSNDYSINISDIDILNNKIINKIRKEFLNIIKKDKSKIARDVNINIKINYKIPGFYNIYKEIKEFIEKEKLDVYYRQDENEIRRCRFELRSRTVGKLKDDMITFNQKLYIELTSNNLFNKVFNTNISVEDKNYIDFCELFLNDYITFYLGKLYNDVNNDFIINDIPHKIILLLLDIKFSELKDDENYKLPLQNIIAKILWLEANSKNIKNILDLLTVISINIAYYGKEKNFLFKKILFYNSKNDIEYKPKEEELSEVNVPYYKLIIIFFKCMIDKESIKNLASENDSYFNSYFSYFKDLERCLKDFQNLDQLLKLDIKELSVLNEFINIYKVFEHLGKVNKLDINKLINNLTKCMEINNEIDSLCENLKTLIDIIKKSLYDSSKENEIKGNSNYYGLISDIFINEIKRENNLKYKMFILNEFLLKDEKLFIQSNNLIRIIMEDFVSSNLDQFQGSLDKLSYSELKILNDKTNIDWIKETLIYIFEQISIIYIKNRIKKNDEAKPENKKNIVFHLKSYFERCCELLEKLFKDSLTNKKEEEGYHDPEETRINSNLNLKKLFSLSFIRVYLKTFIDWIDKDKLKNSEIDEIIENINGKENNSYRDMLQCFIYKILYNINQQDINKLFDKKIIDKFHLNNYSSFKLFEKEKNLPQSFKEILFVDAYKNEDKKEKKIFIEHNYKDFETYENIFNKLNNCLQNLGEKENELKEIISDNTLDIFYSVFSTKISSYLSNSLGNEDKIKILSDITYNIFKGKEKLFNIFKLFLDKSKYTKSTINYNTAIILQFCLRFCLNSDEISEDDNHIYYPLYSDEKDINSYIPGNDIKYCKLYNDYSKIKKYLENNPSSHGIYVCACKIYEKDGELNIKIEENNNGYPITSGKCKYCDEKIGNDGSSYSFYDRDYYYRIFKNEDDLNKEIKDKKNGRCITLEKFYEKFLDRKIKEDSKGVNISKKSHFDNSDKPIRKQSQIGFRLMNLILYSHLFTNTLFTDKEELFSDGKLSYLDYIIGNWNKLEKLLNEKGVNIYIFMNLVYKDLLNYLNKQKIVYSYSKLLEIEKEIENIIEKKIYQKTIKVKESLYTQYEIYYVFYTLNKNRFREGDAKSKISLVKQIYPSQIYKDEKLYPFYKNFLYSDYLDINFYKEKLEEINKEKFPVVDLYLNKGNDEGKLNKDFICFNFVIKSLVNQYSRKINKKEAKKITFGKTDVYRENPSECNKFINIINSKNGDKKLTRESKLENFLINSTTENGKIFIELYKEYADNQNNLLNEIIKKINAINYEKFECQDINIQEAKEEDLIFFKFENENEVNEIFLMNTFREIYKINNGKSTIKYDNYNLFAIDFSKIEKILEDALIKNSFFLKTDEIIEMIYSNEEFLNDGISELNKKIQEKKSLDIKDKKEFIIFYEKNLEHNLINCFEIHKNFNDIVKYVNKNIKKVKNEKSLFEIINDNVFPPKIKENLKEFLKNNSTITVDKLSELIKFFEQLYFDIAMEKVNE